MQNEDDLRSFHKKAHIVAYMKDAYIYLLFFRSIFLV